VSKKYKSEREEKLLAEIIAKLMSEHIGILLWGSTVALAENGYRAILVDEDGKLVASSS